ncbi:MAG: hypothetical protein ACFFDR_10615 [Candidatus Thorarchaeota archaeon]
MMKNEMTIEQQNKDSISIVRRILSVTWNSFVWGFLSALVIGCFVSGVWTIIPTSLLPWGSSQLNLIGYVSHCSFAPISTSILFGSALIGLGLMLKKGGKKPIGYTVFGTTGFGTLIGMIGGLDTSTFITMGIGVGVGVVLGILVGLLWKSGR